MYKSIQFPRCHNARSKQKGLISIEGTFFLGHPVFHTYSHNTPYNDYYLFIFLTCNQSLGTNQTMFFAHAGWVPTIELIKYSFVLHHQHGRRASEESKCTFQTFLRIEFCPTLMFKWQKIDICRYIIKD